MSYTLYNLHEFNLQTKKFEQEAYDSALNQAKDFAQSQTTTVKTYLASRKICREAFEKFKKNIEATFPWEVYKDLIPLTIKSREKLFFVDLKDRLTTIFVDPKELP